MCVPSPARTEPDDGLTYVIGDIHGCADLLDALLAAIERHRGGEARRLVVLGDMVDRGPDSARVVATLRALQAREPDSVTCLMGNHEAMMLDTAAGDDPALWLRNGGGATLDSFGVGKARSVPMDVLNWLAGLPSLHADARRWFVHGGLVPGLAPERCDLETRLWMREPFLSADYDFGRHVVHGHTPLARRRPDERRHRTNLDTGAVFGGWLTAGVFTDRRGPAVDYLQVR
jgi:serine/threonine protein phosphatase 1